MGFFDRLKKMVGGGGPDETPGDGAEPAAPTAPTSAAAGKKRRGERPPLASPAPPSATLDDAFAARDAGDRGKARAILQAIDRGAGLRTVLRAAAAIEDGDDEEVRSLLPKLAAADAPWRLPLQLAAALGDARGEPYVRRSTALQAPPWAVAWARCAIGDADGKRRALVDLLFADAALARTVAARDLKIEGAHEDATAIARYASLDAGRAALHRFGVEPLITLLGRIDPALVATVAAVAPGGQA